MSVLLQCPFILINGSISWIDACSDQVGHHQSNSEDGIKTKYDPIVEERMDTNIEDNYWTNNNYICKDLLECWKLRICISSMLVCRIVWRDKLAMSLSHNIEFYYLNICWLFKVYTSINLKKIFIITPICTHLSTDCWRN